MNRAEKMFKNAECLDNYGNNCNNGKLKQFVNIIFTLCDTQNEDKKKKLEIDVGKKKKDFFESFLFSTTNKFSVIASNYKGESQLILRDNKNKVPHTLATINLSGIKDLHIEEDSDRTVDLYRYNIYFNYDNVIDYHVHIVSMG